MYICLPAFSILIQCLPLPHPGIRGMLYCVVFIALSMISCFQRFMPMLFIPFHRSAMNVTHAMYSVLGGFVTMYTGYLKAFEEGGKTPTCRVVGSANLGRSHRVTNLCQFYGPKSEWENRVANLLGSVTGGKDWCPDPGHHKSIIRKWTKFPPHSQQVCTNYI
jgi:hypothetical protein